MSEGYRTNLYRFLDRRRLLGTRLKLVSPEYIELRLYLEVSVMPQFRQAETMIRQSGGFPGRALHLANRFPMGSCTV